MSSKKPTAGIVLAAGKSDRFGYPKQLLKLRGKYLLEHVLDAALESRLDHLVLVLGYAQARIRRALGRRLEHPRLEVVVNRQYAQGQSGSLQSGLLKIKDRFAAVMFLLGDQPMVDAAAINHLLERFRSSDKDICVAVHQGKRCTPTLFGQAFYRELADLKGDAGARQLIKDNPDRVLAVEIRTPLFWFDVDTAEDFAALQNCLEHAGSEKNS